MLYKFFILLLTVFFLYHLGRYLISFSKRSRLQKFADAFLLQQEISAYSSFFEKHPHVRISGQFCEFPMEMEIRCDSANDGDSFYQTFKILIPNPIQHMKVSSETLSNITLKTTKSTAKEAFRNVENRDRLQAPDQKAGTQNLPEIHDAENAFDVLSAKGLSPLTLDPDGRLWAKSEEIDFDPESLKEIFDSLVILARLCTRKKVEVGSEAAEQFVWTGGSQAALCPYCRDSIDNFELEVVSCGRCHTLHHEQCFEEAGACTIFACGGQTPEPVSGSVETNGDQNRRKASE
jgi:hypothetical protein